jgi:hypothetical protein
VRVAIALPSVLVTNSGVSFKLSTGAQSYKRNTLGEFSMSRNILCAVATSAIVLFATLALVKQSHAIARTNSPIGATLSYVAVPGFAVGVVVGMLVSHSTHNSSFWLALSISIPVNWLLYYFGLLGVFGLWDRWPGRKVRG